MDKQELVKILLENNIDLSNFGIGSAKTLDHLLREVNGNECLLEVVAGHLLRTVEVMQIKVFSKTDDGHNIQIWRLVESRQVFKDGRVRVRKDLNCSVAEKMIPDETPHSALGRALHEELGVSEFILSGPIINEAPEMKESPSYPGLTTIFRRHNAEVVIPYQKEGFVEHQTDKDTYFEWVLEEKR